MDFQVHMMLATLVFVCKKARLLMATNIVGRSLSRPGLSGA
jgi:hypothetical protein